MNYPPTKTLLILTAVAILFGCEATERSQPQRASGTSAESPNRKINVQKKTLVQYACERIKGFEGYESIGGEISDCKIISTYQRSPPAGADFALVGAKIHTAEEEHYVVVHLIRPKGYGEDAWSVWIPQNKGFSIIYSQVKPTNEQIRTGLDFPAHGNFGDYLNGHFSAENWSFFIDGPTVVPPPKDPDA